MLLACQGQQIYMGYEIKVSFLPAISVMCSPEVGVIL